MLNLKEQLFVKEYIINKGNAYQAALRAGYSKNTASHATEWLEKTPTNPDEKRHLPYKPELKAAIDAELKKIDSAKTADAKEVMEYLTSVMRKESLSSEIVVVTGADRSLEAREIERTPTEKEALDAAKQLSKVLGMDVQNINMNADMDLNITVNRE